MTPVTAVDAVTAASQPRVEGVVHRFFHTGEVTLHVAEVGRGPLVLFLHGFPEFWWCWRHQLLALAAAGLRAAAPDLRGYNLSDQPPDVAAYAAPRLAADIAALIRALGDERATLVGHDWGGVLAWEVASRYPERVERLATLNAPHPVAFRRALRSPGQLVRSSYMAAFQLPSLPERAIMAADGALLRAMLRGLRASRPGREELDAYVAAARRGGSLRGALNYYRAAVRCRRAQLPGDPPRRREPLEAPVLVVWGERDPVLGPELARPPHGAARDVRIERIVNASHDVHLDEPDRVSRLLLELVNGGSAARAPPR